jgi:hypothetical protein
MPAQLIDHRLAEDRFLGRMMKDVEGNEAGVQRAFRHRVSMTIYDIEYR